MKSVIVERVCRRCGHRRRLFKGPPDRDGKFRGNYPQARCPKCGHPGFDAQVCEK